MWKHGSDYVAKAQAIEAMLRGLDMEGVKCPELEQKAALYWDRATDIRKFLQATDERVAA